MKKNTYTSQEKKKWQKAQEDKLNLVTTQIQKIINCYEQDPDQIAELLAFGSRFYQYSCRNKMLIANQNKYATFVQSYQKWKEAGYDVIDAKNKLAVLVPVKITCIQKYPNSKEYIPLSQATADQKTAYKAGGLQSRSYQRFNIGYVYDISQTNCPVEDYPKYYHMGYNNEDQKLLAEGLIDYAREDLATDVHIIALPSISLRGEFYPIPIGERYHLTLNEKLKDTEKLSSLSHELGHAAIHKNMPSSPEFQKELEADCFSIMLENHLGIDITEGRKRHLADHYKDLLEYNGSLLESETQQDQVITIEQIINNVFRRYQEEIPSIDHHIANWLEQDNIKTCTEEHLHKKDYSQIPNSYKSQKNAADRLVEKKLKEQGVARKNTPSIEM